MHGKILLRGPLFPVQNSQTLDPLFKAFPGRIFCSTILHPREKERLTSTGFESRNIRFLREHIFAKVTTYCSFLKLTPFYLS